VNYTALIPLIDMLIDVGGVCMLIVVGEVVQSGVYRSGVNHLWPALRYALLTTTALVTVIWRPHHLQWTVTRRCAHSPTTGEHCGL